jgi:SAM-dependent methyltransferase
MAKSNQDKQKIRAQRSIEIDRCFSVIGHYPRKMLDVGHGNGAISNYYHTKGIDITGIEVVPAYVEMASQMYPEVKFILYDGKNFPFEDSIFDTIILNDVLEHISYEDIETVLSEVKRVLTPDGVVYISVMNRWQLIEPHTLIPLLTWLPRVAWNSICQRLKGRGYINYWPYTRKRLHRLLSKNEFSYSDMTYIYVIHKMTGKNPVGDRMTSKLVALMNRLRLFSLAYYLALKVSVLLYVAHKE